LSEPVSNNAADVTDPRLIAVLEECLTGLEQGVSPNRDVLRAKFPDLARELFACLDGLEFVHRASPDAVPAVANPFSLPEAPGRIGDFRLIREVGRGGMGIVYEAEQVSLNRHVALKVLPFASSLDSSQLQRFQNEARVGALLQHPHIVPVFATGCERGVYYYAMQFIDGPSLAGVIGGHLERANLRAGGNAGAATPGIGGLPTLGSKPASPSASAKSWTAASFREAARLGAEAAEALEAAHQAGVIHRDIKPSNLLLENSGNLRVADFGLARINSDAGLTRTGNLLGTLRYMSPEQALAKPGLVDHRTDIYSLGATLYELIALRPAFVGSNREELLRQIDKEEPPRLSSVNSSVPAPLQAIVSKAMAKDPADRYATAAALALDLRRFLEGKPVQARRPSLIAVCRRWAVRHSTAVLTAAALATLLLGIVSASAILISRERDAARADKQQARRAVDDMYTDVAERWLARQPHLELVQQEFLEKARRYYEQFSRDASTDAATRGESARASRRLGDIDSRLGHFPEAEAAYEQARRQLQELNAEQSAEPDLREEWARLRSGRGQLFFRNNRLSAAEEEYRAALVCYERLASVSGERCYQLGRCGADVNLGTILGATGRLQDAEEAYSRARATLESLGGHGDAEVLFDLAGVLTDHANLLASTRPAEAEKLYRKAISIEERLFASAPGQPGYREALATTAQSLATILLGADRLLEARTLVARSLQLREHLAADYPHAPVYREQIARGRMLLGDILSQSGRPGEAATCYLAAAVNFESLAEAMPAYEEYRRGEAEAMSRRGDIQSALGQPLGAVASYRSALSKLASLAPGRLVRQDMARTNAQLASAMSVAGRVDEAELAYESALRLWQPLVSEPLPDDSAQCGLASTLCQYAELQKSCGRTDAGEAALQRAVTIAENLATAHAALSIYRRTLAAALSIRGALLCDTGRLVEAEADLRRAVAIANSLVTEHADVPAYRRVLAESQVIWSRLPGARAEREEALGSAAGVCRALSGTPARVIADDRILADALQGLAELHQSTGAGDLAAKGWRAVFRQRVRLAAEYPTAAVCRIDLAWFLVAAPADPTRDWNATPAAVTAAIDAIPGNPDSWLVAGAAECRRGDWIDAIANLERYARLRNGAASPAGFFLAMAHARLGARDLGKTEFEQADTWRKQNRRSDHELERLRDEVAALLN
jgi:hypothetical protein